MVTLGLGSSFCSDDLADGARVTRLHIINTVPKTKIGNIAEYLRVVCRVLEILEILE